MPINQLGVPTCQRRTNFSTSPAKRRTNFSTTFQKNFSIFEFFNYAQHLQNFTNIWAILENLSRETKNLNFDICKISLRKNLVSLTPLTTFSMEHNYSASVNWSWIYVFIYAMCKQGFLEKHAFFKKHSCWKSIHHLSWLRNYCTAGTTALENIVVRNGKKHSQNKVSYNYLGFSIQSDPNSRRSQNLHVFFILFSCFSWGNFEKILATSNL